MQVMIFFSLLIGLLLKLDFNSIAYKSHQYGGSGAGEHYLSQNALDNQTEII